jgi:hypothetical protein
VLKGAPWEITERDFHSQTWGTSLSWVDPASGKTFTRKGRFVELATGLNFRDERGQWQPTREEFQVAPNGTAVARFGPHQLIVAPNVNDWVVDFLSSDGQRFRAGPVAIGYFDPLGGTNVILARIRDTTGQLTAANEVPFEDCFEGALKALIVHEAPPDPSTLGLSPFVRLELYSEFSPDSPVPQAIIPRVLRAEGDPALRPLLVEPDLVDHLLDFGPYKIGTGTAFEWNTGPNPAKLPVAKRFLVTPEGRRILIEAVEYSEASRLFAALPKADKAGQVSSLSQTASVATAEPASRLVEPADEQTSGTGKMTGLLSARSVRVPTRLIPTRPPAQTLRKPVQEARAALLGAKSTPAFVLDWSLLTGDTNVTLAGDTTYFVSGAVYLYGVTTIEEGAVVKFTNSLASGGLRIRGELDCQTSPYRPAVLTSQNDDAVGQSLPWSTGHPTNYYGSPALELDYYASNTAHTVQHVRVSHANAGLSFFGGRGDELKHAQFVHCDTAFTPCYCDVNLRNVLVCQASNVFSGSSSSTCRVEHLTVDQASNLTANATLWLTNSLLVNVVNTNSFGGLSNEVTSASNVFQVLGAGAHYLATNTYRHRGTTNVNLGLLTDLRQRTTHAPRLLTNTVTSNTWLTPVTPRSTDAPDLDWLYPAVDYAASVFTLSNSATVNVTFGTVIASFGSCGLWILDGSQLVCEGTPRQCIHFVPFYAVQELSTNWGGLWPGQYGEHPLQPRRQPRPQRPFALHRFRWDGRRGLPALHPGRHVAFRLAFGHGLHLRWFLPVFRGARPPRTHEQPLRPGLPAVPVRPGRLLLQQPGAWGRLDDLQPEHQPLGIPRQRLRLARAGRRWHQQTEQQRVRRHRRPAHPYQRHRDHHQHLPVGDRPAGTVLSA